MAYTVAALGPDPGLRVAVLQDQIAAYNSAWPVSQPLPAVFAPEDRAFLQAA